MSNEYEQRDGLYRVGPASTDTLVNVVFVHGLGGGAYSTWNSGDASEVGFWPQRIAEDHPRCGIWTLHYTARILEWNPFARTRTIDLLDRAAWMLGLLEQEKISSKPIVFVSHSLGGLLVKQALQFAHSLGPENWRNVWDRTHAVLFLATPHSGSALADVSMRLTEVMKSTGSFTRIFLRPSAAIRNLVKNNPTLRYLSSWYRDQDRVQFHEIETIAFAERRPCMGLMVVDETSADPQVPNCVPIPLPGDDHISIAKPTSIKHEVYRRLSDLLAELVIHPPMPAWPRADSRTRQLRAESRELALRLCGMWCERHLNMDPALVSFFSIDPDTLLDSIRLDGYGYNAQGETVSSWHSVLARVERDRENNDIVVRYVWNGEYLKSEGAKFHMEPFNGFAEFQFKDTAASGQVISAGKGHYWNVNEREPEKTEFRRLELRRITNQDDIQIMEKKHNIAEKAQCIRKTLDDWQ